MNKNTQFVVISLIVVAVSSLIFWSVVSQNQDAPTSPAGQDGVATQTPQSADTTPPLRGPEPPRGHSEDTETIKLQATAPYTGEATVTRSFDGTWFVLSIAADLPDPPPGKVYDAYLVKPSGTPEFYFLEKLTKENGVYLRTLFSRINMPEHTEVLITEDSAKNPRQDEAAPEVLKGSF